MTRHRVLAVAACAALMACGGNAVHSVLEPPQFDLLKYGSVGLVTFSIENAKGSLHQFATHRFEESILGAQPGFEVREFPFADSGLAQSGGGGDHPVPVVFYGWRSSAAATEKVGDLAIVDGIPSFSARDPNDAYGVLVSRLVRAVTYDFRSTWVTVRDAPHP